MKNRLTQTIGALALFWAATTQAQSNLTLEQRITILEKVVAMQQRQLNDQPMLLRSSISEKTISSTPASSKDFFIDRDVLEVGRDYEYICFVSFQMKSVNDETHFIKVHNGDTLVERKTLKTDDSSEEHLNNVSDFISGKFKASHKKFKLEVEMQVHNELRFGGDSAPVCLVKPL